jgi:prefoldin subunit 5
MLSLGNVYIFTSRYICYMVESEAEVSVEFVLNVLRQHENDLDRSIAELELLLHKITELTNKLQQIMENSSRSQLT